MFILFEDAHWADATSLEVLDLLIQSVPRLAALSPITFRPEFEAQWSALPDVAKIALGRFDRIQAETLVARVTGGRELPAEVLAQIVAKTDWVPLFVEELTKNVLESGLLVEGVDRYRLDGPLPPLAIPSTLQDLSMARLDRLAAVKDIAQIGAAIGGILGFLVRAVVGRDEPTLRAALAQLEESAPRLPLRRAARRPLRVQARPGPGHRVPKPAQEPAADPASEDRGDLARAFRRYRRGGARAACPPLYAGRPGRDRNRVLAQGWDLALYRSAFTEAIAHLGKAIEMADGIGRRAQSATGH